MSIFIIFAVLNGHKLSKNRIWIIDRCLTKMHTSTVLRTWRNQTFPCGTELLLAENGGLLCFSISSHKKFSQNNCVCFM